MQLERVTAAASMAELTRAVNVWALRSGIGTKRFKAKAGGAAWIVGGEVCIMATRATKATAEIEAVIAPGSVAGDGTRPDGARIWLELRKHLEGLGMLAARSDGGMGFLLRADYAYAKSESDETSAGPAEPLDATVRRFYGRLTKADQGKQPTEPSERYRQIVSEAQLCKEQHPEWTYDTVAQYVAQALSDTGITGETVRNAYRATGTTWRRGERIATK